MVCSRAVLTLDFSLSSLSFPLPASCSSSTKATALQEWFLATDGSSELLRGGFAAGRANKEQSRDTGGPVCFLSWDWAEGLQ